MTPAELEELARTQVSTDLVTAGRAWGIGRTKVHDLARQQATPFPVVRLGTAYRVPVEGLLRSLGLPMHSSEAGPATGPAVAPTTPKPSPERLESVRC